EKSPIMPLVTDRTNSYNFVGNDGSVFYFETDKDAERSRLVSVDVSAKTPVWKEIVPQADETLGNVQMINDQFVLNYLKDAYTQIKVVDKDGKFVRSVELPGIGSA